MRLKRANDDLKTEVKQGALGWWPADVCRHCFYDEVAHTPDVRRSVSHLECYGNSLNQTVKSVKIDDYFARPHRLVQNLTCLIKRIAYSIELELGANIVYHQFVAISV